MSASISESFISDLVLSQEAQEVIDSSEIWIEGNETTISNVASREMIRALDEHNLERMELIGRNLSIIQSNLDRETDKPLGFFFPHIQCVLAAIDLLRSEEISKEEQPNSESTLDRIGIEIKLLGDTFSINRLNILKSLIDQAESDGDLSTKDAQILRQTLNFIDLRSKPEEYPMEERVFGKIAREFATLNTNIHRYHENKKVVHKDQREHFLAMMRSDKPLSALIQDCGNKFEHLPEETLAARFEKSIPPKAAENKKFVRNYTMLVLKLDEYIAKTNGSVQEAIQELYSTYDAASNARFSGLVAKYPHLDIRSRSDEVGVLCATGILESKGTFPTEALFHMEPTDFGKHANTVFNQYASTPRKAFFVVYNRCYKNQHTWLYENVDSLVKSYSQSLDHNTPGRGGCFSNASQRYRLLHDEPTLSSKKIPMGSIGDAKFAHARIQVGSSLTPNSGIVQEYLGVKNPRINGFGSIRYIPLNKIGLTSEDAIIDWLASRKDSPQCVFIFDYQLPGETRAAFHAINVQIDHQNQKFRIIDDNYGVIEYQDFHSFRSGFVTFLHANYPGYKSPAAYYLKDRVF